MVAAQRLGVALASAVAGEVRFDDAARAAYASDALLAVDPVSCTARVDSARFWCGPTDAVEMQRIVSRGGRHAEIYSALQRIAAHA